jgi:hypothetical protein
MKAEQEKRLKEMQEEHEKNLLKVKADRKAKYERSGKLVEFAQDWITKLSKLDLQKKILASHKGLSAIELFEEMDAEKKNFLTVSDLEAYFKEDAGLDKTKFLNLVKLWNGTEHDDRLTVEDLAYGLGISSSSQVSISYSPSRYGGYERQTVQLRSSWDDEEQKEQGVKQWKAQLKVVIALSIENLSAAPVELAMTKDEACAIWSDLDPYKSGYAGLNAI